MLSSDNREKKLLRREKLNGKVNYQREREREREDRKGEGDRVLSMGLCNAYLYFFFSQRGNGSSKEEIDRYVWETTNIL